MYIYYIHIYIYACIALHCIALHYTTLHYITLHYILLNKPFNSDNSAPTGLRKNFRFASRHPDKGGASKGCREAAAAAAALAANDECIAVDGRNPAPVERWFTSHDWGSTIRLVMQDFATIHSMSAM